RRVVGIGDRDVGGPCRTVRRTVGSPPETGDVAAPQAGHEVRLRRAGRHHVLALPSEEPAVEAHGGAWVGLAGVDPTRNTRQVSVSVRHAASSPASLPWCCFRCAPSAPLAPRAPPSLPLRLRLAEATPAPGPETPLSSSHRNRPTRGMNMSTVTMG